MPPAEFTCEHCGVVFYKPAGWARAIQERNGKPIRYCSHKCFGLATRGEWRDIPCAHCGTMITRPKRRTVRSEQLFCSRECHYQWARDQDRHPEFPDYNARVHVGRHGYLRVAKPLTPTEPKSEALLHRLVMEKKLGRKLLPGETAHHKDGDRQNVEPSNLELWSSNHGPGQRVSDKVRWAIELLKRYPEFAEEQGYEIVTTNDAKLIDDIRYPEGKWKNSPVVLGDLPVLSIEESK